MSLVFKNKSLIIDKVSISDRVSLINI